MWHCRSKLAGGVIWLIALFVLQPSPFGLLWAQALLMLASLVLIPIGLGLALSEESRLSELARWIAILQLPAALLLGGAFLLPQGILAAALALPWLVTTGLIALLGLLQMRSHWRGQVHELCRDVGLIYLVVGGFWTVIDRFGWRPLDFEPAIVLLTAIHFHYAGFILPIVAGLSIREIGGRSARTAGIGVVLGVPLLAVGITATKLGFAPWLECAAAFLLASAGFVIACLHFRLATRSAWSPVVRILWMMTGISLSAAMLLAGLYGCRFYISIAWLDIPWMRALHGSANALGFGLVGLLSWTLALAPRRTAETSTVKHRWRR